MKLIRRISLLGLIGLISPLLAHAQVTTSTNYQIDSSSFVAGGGNATTSNFQLESATPFVSASGATTTNYQIESGGALGALALTMPTLTTNSGPALFEVSLTWTAVVNLNNVQYEPGYGLGDGTYTYASAQSTLAKTFSSLTPLTNYTFIVRVKDGLGNIIGYSNTVIAIPYSGGAGGSSPAPAPPAQGGQVGDQPEDKSLTASGPLPFEKGEASVIEKIIDFFAPEPPAPTPVPIEQFVPKEAPAPLKGVWNLLPQPALNKFVFAPLPKEIDDLVSKFPQLGTLFKEVGITSFNDLQKLRTTRIKIPGLSDILALPTVKIPGTSVKQPANIRIADLTAELKRKFPSGVLFTRIGAGTIDVEPRLIVGESGVTQERVSVITGETINFSIKPEFPVRSIIGYLVVAAPSPFAKGREPLSGEGFLAQALNPPSPSDHPPLGKEEGEVTLVLDTFTYTDEDNDGIYTANVRAPLVSGTYENITVIEYKDPALGTQVLRLITVVDPEGYIYKTYGKEQIRVNGAVVTLSWLNPETKSYEQWPAEQYSQENPQVTGVSGQYSFLVPPGFYQLTVEVPGLETYIGEPFLVREGSGIHENIEMKPRFSFFKNLDWKTIAIALIGLLLLYHLIRERRERELKQAGYQK